MSGLTWRLILRGFPPSKPPPGRALRTCATVSPVSGLMSYAIISGLVCTQAVYCIAYFD